MVHVRLKIFLQLNLILLNLVSSESASITHQVVSTLQQRPQLARVVVVGAALLPSAPAGQVYHALLNGCKLPPTQTPVTVPLPGKLAYVTVLPVIAFWPMYRLRRLKHCLFFE